MWNSLQFCILVFASSLSLACGQWCLAQAEAATALDHFLAAEQVGRIQVIGNWLETYPLSPEQTQRLITAAQSEDAPERRNLIWHAIRCCRSLEGRDYLMHNLVEDSHDSTKLRFVQTLTNLAPFDVPLLIALYQAGDPCLQAAIFQVVIQDRLVEALSPRPDFIPERETQSVTNYRTTRATQGRLELLMWMAHHAADESHRLSVIEPVLEELDSPRQKQFAQNLLASAKDPAERAKLIPLLCRRYALDPYPLLVKQSETEATRLAILEGLHMLGSSYGYTLGSIVHGQETLRYISNTDPSPSVREAAKQLLERLQGSSGR